jgi:putative ABC transport system substrate-binding protein
VFISGADPVEGGLVRSLNRPGGNVTGVSFIAPTLNPKRLELLHQLVPPPAAIALMWDPSRNSGARDPDAQLRDMEAAARSLGRQILIRQAGTEGEIETAFASFAREAAGAVLISSGAFYLGQRRKIIALAERYSLPASYHLRDFVVEGGLMSYGASLTDAFRRGGLYVGRILKGEKPGDLPVELPTRYQFVINLRTARALGLTVPPTLLALADEFIE